MRVTLLAAIVNLFTIPQRHLADNFCIESRCQLLTETFAVNIRYQLSIETFGVEIWLKLLIAFRCQLLTETFDSISLSTFDSDSLSTFDSNSLSTFDYRRAVELSSALLNSNWFVSKVRFESCCLNLIGFSCLKFVSKAELSNVRIELISTLISERVDNETWQLSCRKFDSKTFNFRLIVAVDLQNEKST